MLQQHSSICIMQAVIKNNNMDIESEGPKVNMSAQKITLSAFVSLLCISPYFTCQVLAQEGTPVLQGSVKEQTYLGPNKNPSLNRRDLNSKVDSFGSSGTMGMPSVGESFEPPPDAFNLQASENKQVANASPPGLVQPANLDFNSDQTIPGLATTSQFNMSAEELRNDPDNSPEMQLAWDEWHKRVAAAVYEKFNSIAQLAFKYSKPLACYVTYTVTNDGKVMNVQLSQRSANVAFNAMVVLVINSMSGQTSLLAFPPNSRRMFVHKAGMFTQNYGVQGFKYTTGDRETIPSPN